MPRPKKKNPTEKAKLFELKKQIIDKVLLSKKNGAGSSNLGALANGWLELESDPGTFSLLVEDLGCFGAQVDEIYDLEQKFERPVYGFIFLFKWFEKLESVGTRVDRQLDISRKGLSVAGSKGWSHVSGPNATTSTNGQSTSRAQQHDEGTTNEIFFAKQMISSSCATHALISVLLNCDHDGVELGPTLTHLREYTKDMAPEDKGHAIGNLPLIAKAHNSHASYSSLYCRDIPNHQRGLSFAIRGNQRTSLQQSQPDTYHFVSFVPIKNHLYELDGLKDRPIDHGPINPNEDWTEMFRRVIKQRLLAHKIDDTTNEIRFNLMAVVPDRRLQLKLQAKRLKRHHETAIKTIEKLEKNQICKYNDKTKTKSTSCVDDNDRFYSASSSASNGTLTASETGSVCAESPKLCEDGETGDIDIPNPPFSPLSNDTLTASETGSTCNALSRFDDSFLLDDKDQADKYFFVKFNPKAEIRDADAVAGQAIKSEANRKCVQFDQLNEPRLIASADMRRLSEQIQRDICKNQKLLDEENEKRRKYKLDNSRRTHNYEPFIMTFLSMLAKQGNLADLMDKHLGIECSKTPNPTPKPKQKLKTVTQLQKPEPTSKPNRQHIQPSAKITKIPTTNPPLQPKANNNFHKVKKEPPKEPPQEPPQAPQVPPEEGQEPDRPRLSLSGRPIRSTKSRYISTGMPRGVSKTSS